MRSLKFLSIGIVGVILAVVLALGFSLVTNAAPLLPNGLTAKVIATSGQIISGNIDATGYDVGIYIGPGVRNVIVTRATVSNANDEGILVQDTSNICITDSTISNNGNTGNTHSSFTEDKAIVLAGTTKCLVKNNTVQDNGHGGISLLDDGPRHPFAVNTVATTPIAGTWNVISGNLIQRNAADCGIVVAAKNAGPGVHDNVILKNTVIGGWSGTPGESIPYVGAIVVAAGAGSSYARTTNNIVLNNVVTGGLLPGIVLHCFPSGVISGTQLIGNVLSNNGAGEPGLPGDPQKSTGIAIVAVGLPGPSPVLTNTQVLSDTVSNDYYGVWVGNATATHIVNLTTSSVTVPVYP